MLITKDTRIIYKNEIGGEIEFSPFSVYYLEDFEEETKNNIVTNKTNLIHGENYISNSLESRYITLSGFIEKGATTTALTSNLIKIINPTLKGKLIWQSEKEMKEIEVIAEGIPLVAENSGLIRFSISLIANNPFWHEEESIENIALLIPQLVFPLIIPKNKGIIFGLKKSAMEVEVKNIGDVESGIRVIFKAKGSVVNPKIFNKLTGDYIKLNCTMQKGDSIEVISYPEKKKVTVNSITNGFKYLDIGSNFFNLAVGRNIIGYFADTNTTNLDVIVYYTPRFLGV